MQNDEGTNNEPRTDHSKRYRAIQHWLIIMVIGLAPSLLSMIRSSSLVPHPHARLLGVFAATIVGMVLHPMPAGAVVLLGIIALALFCDVPLKEALSGYSDATVWLVLAAYFLSRACIKTGLARRIALWFVRATGRSTLGLAYGLGGADLLLAAFVPSNAARVGGVMLPIVRGICDLFDSKPGATANRLALFLMLNLYQLDCVCCSLYLTGQAGNPIGMKQANEQLQKAGSTFQLNYANWILVASVPALISFALVPWLVIRMTNPSIKQTPNARQFADDELTRLGPISRQEQFVFGVFAALCITWILIGQKTELIALPALVAVAIFLLSNILSWNDILEEKSAWDVFIWYGGVVLLADQLNKSGMISDFAKSLSTMLASYPISLVLIVLALVYFYGHYVFASITSHIMAMYPAFLAVLIALGAPPAMVACGFVMITNLSACLTHYGTTPGPIIFALDYVPQSTWWKVGFVLSLVHLAVWGLAGFLWWKLLGLS